MAERVAAETYCRNLPKIELHAHLNGSLSPATIEELKSLKKKTWPTTDNIPLQLSENSLSSCFNYFGQIHDLVRSQEAVALATKRVIEEFFADGVKYLELRSTPKELDNGITRVSKAEYIESILHSIREAKISDFPYKETIVKLLISVDRTRSVQDALENVQLASRFSKQNDDVIGVDFSGHPDIADGRDFIPALQYAKREGLKISTHLAEVPHKEEETLSILESVIPDRIGHGTYMHTRKGGSESIEEFVLANKIPIELCLTSNVSSGTVESFDEHHYKIWHELNHPIVICTDDKGLFNTSLSNEYYLFQKLSSIGNKTLFDLSRKSIEYIFDKGSVENLKKYWDKFNKDGVKSYKAY